jgi:ubiquinol oxidase
MVGHLEEKAVASYSDYLTQLAESGEGARPAPAIAVNYWQLPPTATLSDVVGRIRDDECRHRDINHAMADQIASGRKLDFDHSG